MALTNVGKGATPLTHDATSQSKPHNAIVTHLSWDASVCFSTKIISATVVYSVDKVTPDTTHLILDTSHLSITTITVNSQPTSYDLSPRHETLGSRLSIPLDSNNASAATGDDESSHSYSVAITYKTTDQCSAVQWLPPEQTAGKEYPYLFTQCQAIHARSLLPCQDTPGVKMTYEARITVPSWATAVMSALPLSVDSSSSSTNTFAFSQAVPIPSYLLALAVGSLASHEISPRCRIYTEPSLLSACAYEFAEAETFLLEAEELSCPYAWGRYDILCLPPSFPYGGMENPCLTFVTPTLLAGDRSLVSVLAHEMAHSWTGNLVTNATWEHFWLNEGWTVYFERKIVSRVMGKGDKKVTRAVEHFMALEGFKDLKEDVGRMKDEYTRLVWKLGEEDPDDAYSSVPYDKGFFLLWALEHKVGETAFLDFAKFYLNEFKFKTVTSEIFRDCFVAYFEKRSVTVDIDWGKWFYEPGMPPAKDLPEFDRTLAKQVDDLAKAWLDYDDNLTETEPDGSIHDWTFAQKSFFLDTLLQTTDDRKRPLRQTTIAHLKKRYSFETNKNAEILSRFCQLALKAKDKLIVPTVITLITSQGRMKYVRPLYRDLCQFKKSVAVRTFLKHKTFYHPIAAKMVATDLGLELDKEEDTGTGETVETTKVVTKVNFKEKYNCTFWYSAGVVGIVAVVGMLLLKRRQ